MLHHDMKRGTILFTIALSVLTAASCGGPDASTTTTSIAATDAAAPSGSTTSAPAATSASTTTAASDTIPVPPEGVPITFVTADGVTLEGRRFGTGEDFVVLAHMRPAAMESWFGFAAVLADSGYSAVAFNFRGYGNSGGDGFAVATDAIAAFDYAAESGAARVFAIGASMGGTGVLAATADRDFAGVASLSAPAVFEGSDAVAGVAASTTPLLLIAAEDDGPYPADAAELRSARAGAEVVILSGGRHGTDMFLDHGKELEETLLEFLAGRS
jgi:pimeloyl-ACP methyl ester carboxylesterase